MSGAPRPPAEGQPRAAPNSPLGWREALALGLWTGLLAGGGDLAYLAARRYFRDLLLFQGSDPHVLWVAPLANALLFAGLTAMALVAGRRWHSASQPSAVLGLLAFLLVTSLLLMVPPLHPGAAVLFGLGAGVQAGRLLPRQLERLRRLVRLTLPAGLLLVGLVAGAIPLLRWREARQAEARLPPPTAGAPNVLLILLDTVRSFNLSAYGYPRETTPLLARRAVQGVRFAHAFSTAPWTLPGHASIMTGREAHELSTDWQKALDGSFPTLAEVLRSRGYRTGGFVANLAYCSRETGLARGFTSYDDYRVNFDRFVSSASITRRIVDPRAVRQLLWDGDMLGRKPAPVINQAFLHWVRSDSSRPFLAFLNYYDAHVPYRPPEPFRSRFQSPGVPLQANLIREGDDTLPWPAAEVQGLEDAYDGAIAYLDAQVDSLLTTLGREGRLENTLVILTSDHGEEFNEHGIILHGNTLYRPSLEVPLLIWFPGRVPAGRVVESPVSNRQIAATVLDLLRVSPSPFPGPSLASAWADSSGGPSPLPLYASVRRAWQLPAWYPVVRGDMASVADGGLRLIRGGDGREELFDFDRDPFERHDLVRDPARAGDLARLRALLEAATPAGGQPR